MIMAFIVLAIFGIKEFKDWQNRKVVEAQVNKTVQYIQESQKLQVKAMLDSQKDINTQMNENDKAFNAARKNILDDQNDTSDKYQQMKQNFQSSKNRTIQDIEGSQHQQTVDAMVDEFNKDSKDMEKSVVSGN